MINIMLLITVVTLIPVWHTFGTQNEKGHQLDFLKLLKIWWLGTELNCRHADFQFK